MQTSATHGTRTVGTGTRTAFCSVLMVDRFHSVVWSQSSCPQ